MSIARVDWIGVLVAIVLASASFGQPHERWPAQDGQPESRAVDVEVLSRWADRNRRGSCGGLAFEILEGRAGALPWR